MASLPKRRRLTGKQPDPALQPANAAPPPAAAAPPAGETASSLPGWVLEPDPRAGATTEWDRRLELAAAAASFEVGEMFDLGLASERAVRERILWALRGSLSENVPEVGGRGVGACPPGGEAGEGERGWGERGRQVVAGRRARVRGVSRGGRGGLGVPMGAAWQAVHPGA